MDGVPRGSYKRQTGARQGLAWGNRNNVYEGSTAPDGWRLMGNAKTAIPTVTTFINSVSARTPSGK